MTAQSAIKISRMEDNNEIHVIHGGLRRQSI